MGSISFSVLVLNITLLCRHCHLLWFFINYIECYFISTLFFFFFSYLYFCIHKYSLLGYVIVLPLRNLLFTLCCFFCAWNCNEVPWRRDCFLVCPGLVICFFSEKVKYYIRNTFISHILYGIGVVDSRCACSLSDLLCKKLISCLL